MYSMSLHSAEGTLELSFSLEESSLLRSRLSTVESIDSSSSDLSISPGRAGGGEGEENQ